MSSYVDVGLRELVKRGHVPGPDLLAAGYHVRTHPAPELFLSDPDLGDLLAGVTSVEALRRVVRANLAHGVDWIKVTATERAGTPDTDPRKQMFTAGELEVIVGEAALRSIPVQAHAHGAEGADAEHIAAGRAAGRGGAEKGEHGRLRAGVPPYHGRRRGATCRITPSHAAAGPAAATPVPPAGP